MRGLFRFLYYLLTTGLVRALVGQAIGMLAGYGLVNGIRALMGLEPAQEAGWGRRLSRLPQLCWRRASWAIGCAGPPDAGQSCATAHRRAGLHGRVT